MADYRETLIYDADINRVLMKLRTMSAATGRVANDQSSHAGRAGRAWSTFGNVARAGMATLAVGATAGAAALGGLGLWGLRAAGNFQQTRIAFEGILGSGEAAEGFLNRLRDFANSTPFEFPELARAAQQLLGVGFNAQEVIPIMTRVGNVTSALGVGAEGIDGVVRALGQMKGKGRASAEELQQISEAVPGFSAIQAIADSMGISVEDAFDRMSAGAIPADQAIQAILDGMERFPGAAGAMERQSHTLNGVISTFKDTVQTALVDAIEPYLPAIAGGLERATPLVRQGLAAIVQGFGTVVSFVQAHWPQIRAVVDQVLGWFRGDGAARANEGASRLVTGFNNVVAWVRDNWPEIRATVTEVVNGVHSVIENVVNIVQTLWANFGDNIAEHVNRVWPTVRQIISGAMEYIRSIIQVVSGIVSGDWSRVWDGVLGVWRGLWNMVQGILRWAMNMVITVLKAGWEIAKAAFGAGVDAVIGFARSLPGRILSALSRLPGLLVSGGRALINGLLNAAKGTWSFVANWLSSIPGLVLDKIGDLGRVLYNVGRDVINGLWDGMQSMWGEVTGWLSDLNPANHFNDINPYKGHAEVNLYPVGREVFGGLHRGMADGWARTAGWMAGINPAAVIGAGTATNTTNNSVRVIAVGSIDEALGHVDSFARPAARGFLAGRS